MADTYASAVSYIVKVQEAIIGPLALEQAKKVVGVSVDNGGNIKVFGNGKEVLERLVKRYESLFGKASVEACKDAVRGKVKQEELPQILQ